MKKIKDKLFIIMLIIFILFSISSIICLKEYKNNQNLLIEDYENMLLECKNNNIEEQEYCDQLSSSDLSMYNLNISDAYNIYIIDFLRKYLNEFIIIILIIIGSSYYVTKYFRNGIIYNENNRKPYKTIIKNLFFSSWKYALLIPIMLLLIFLIMYINIKINNSIPINFNTLLYYLDIIIQSFLLSLLM